MCDCPNLPYAFEDLTTKFNPRYDSYRGFGDYIKTEQPQYSPYNDFFESIKQNTTKYPDENNILSQTNAQPRQQDLHEFMQKFFKKKNTPVNLEFDGDNESGQRQKELVESFAGWRQIKTKKITFKILINLYHGYFGDYPTSTTKKTLINEISETFNNLLSNNL